MCGRYSVYVDDDPGIREIIEQVQKLHPQVKTGEIFPTNLVPVLQADSNGERLATAMFWGFPAWKGTRPIINARSETAAEKKTFQVSLKKRRCVIPSTGYFEWNKEKQKLIFRHPHSAAVYLAGIWNDYGGEQRFCILTRTAETSISAIHDRMPVILRPHELGAWMYDRAAAELILRGDPPILEYKTA